MADVLDAQNIARGKKEKRCAASVLHCSLRPKAEVCDVTSMECKHTCRYYREMPVMRLAVRKQCNFGSAELKLASPSTTSVLEWKMLGLWIHNMVPDSNSSAKCISGSSASAATALQVKRKLTPAISLCRALCRAVGMGHQRASLGSLPAPQQPCAAHAT